MARKKARRKKVAKRGTRSGAKRRTTKRKTSKRKKVARKTSRKKTTKKAAKKSVKKSTKKASGGRPRYSESKRREVAEYSIVNGIHAAAKKYGVSAPSVTNWRRALGITRDTKKAALAGRTPKISAKPIAKKAAGRRGYDNAFRREVADYSILNGIQNAAKQYKVSAPSVTNWRREFGITRASRKKALASIGKGTAQRASAAVPTKEVRAVRSQLDKAFRALDDLLAKL